MKDANTLPVIMQEINAVLSKYNVVPEDQHFQLQHVIGQLLLDASYSTNDLSCNNVQWAIDSYVAAKVGPLWPRFLALHKKLAETKKEFDFEHCDRYGKAFANEEKWRSMALQTQNYTYLVVLEQRRCWYEDKPVEAWATHLRICTKGYRSRDFARPEFVNLPFLASHSKVYPEIGYGNDAHDYFRYKDGRDQGYLCSVEPNMYSERGYSTKDTLVNYGLLESVIFDLASHCDCLEEGDYDGN